MRNYGKVYSRFWSSRDMRSLTEDGRYLALYLMTCKHCTIAGIFHLPDGYACDDMQWTRERLAKGLAELERKGFATRCPETQWVWITKHLEWNGLDNPNQAKSAASVLAEVPDYCCWVAEFTKAFGNLIATSARRSTSFRKGSRTLNEGLRNGSHEANSSKTTVPQGLANVQEGLPNGSATTVAEGLANGSGTLSQSVSVSGSVSGTVSVTVPVTHTEGLAAETGDEPGERDGCVLRGDGKSKSNGKEPKPKLNGHGPPPLPEPATFATLKALYPQRAGDQRWAEALTSYTANLQAGHSHEQMLDGVMRYAKYCQAEGITGTKFVQAANTFLGENHAFTQPWTPSAKPKRETVSERWLREQEAKDASH